MRPEIEELAERTVAAIKRYVAAEIGKRDKRIEELEARLPLGYKGVFRQGSVALKGYFYTFAGSVWYCRETTVVPPGDGSQDWQLAAKGAR
jgi:hypothetical protein